MHPRRVGTTQLHTLLDRICSPPTPRLAGTRVLARHQLVPELAVDVARASLVVLVDATVGGEPGTILVQLVRPRRPGPGAFTHHLDPEPLAGLAESLYGGAPRVVLVGVGAGSLDAADHLSDALERALPDVVEVVVDVVSGRPIFDIGP